jgi:DNA (cytosine-5)-methyltransferase 1
VREIIVDNFAGGGGASTGIELAIGRSVDIAINHDPAAIAMHKANHPTSEHYCESVWDIDPVKAVKGRPVALCWFSPDCKHFSKAKGGKPVEKNIRGLAWIAIRWASKVKPRVIMLENVEEFKTWGPLTKDGYPDKDKKGETFNQFVAALKRLGYKVDWRELRACDYGAPTIRKRFFLVARRDGKPIVWPKVTHGNSNSLEVNAGLLKPWKTAADIINWEIPCPSIFDRKKPLSENTLIRIARGLKKFVVESKDPFICKGSPSFISQYYTQQNDESRCYGLDEPLNTIPTANRFALITAFISKYYGGFYEGAGSEMLEPLATITTKERHALVTAFLVKYYGTDIGQAIDTPLHTITTKDRFGLIKIKGEDYRIVDIGMRMLEPHELFKAQGFPEDYIIDKDFEGKPYPKTAQVARCGNAVPPPFAEALVRANLPELCGEKLKEVI